MIGPGSQRFSCRFATSIASSSGMRARWPLPSTAWTKFYLDPADQTLSPHPPAADAAISFAAMGDGLTFVSRPLTEETEITGPLAANLRISSSTEDADLFLVFRAFSADLREVTFVGAIDPHTPIAQGWLRASHRKLDESLSRPYRPYHRHDEVQPLQPGKPVDLAVELWPTSILVPKGYRIALSIRGRDYQWQASTGAKLSNFKNELLGCGPFLHDDPRDRSGRLFSGTTTVHIAKTGFNHVLVPIIASR